MPWNLAHNKVNKYELCNTLSWYVMEYSTSHLCFLGCTHEPFSYFIPCHRKYSNQWDIRMVLDSKVGCNTVDYTAAFLYSDWLYFLWHGLNTSVLRNHKVTSSPAAGLIGQFIQHCSSIADGRLWQYNWAESWINCLFSQSLIAVHNCISLPYIKSLHLQFKYMIYSIYTHLHIFVT